MKSNKKRGLEFLADKIDQDLRKEIEEIEKREVDIPEEYYEQMRPFIHKLNQELEQNKKKQIRQQWLRMVAVFAVAFVSLNVAALGTSEAYREKVFSLIYNEAQNGITFYYDAESKLLESGKPYWFPNWLPGNFKLCAASQIEDQTLLLFLSDDGQEEIRIITHPADGLLSFDTESLKHEKVQILLSEGYYFQDEENKFSYLLYPIESEIIVIEYNGSSGDSSTLIKIAENIRLNNF